ncbi:MAG: hypothetical protein A3F42_07765 [Gammaproteobacteria bacterium RIFCSPHIGHO2_12_FULL_37_34]|nr:MAG: hypothetical protein A3F42_07765 [Gammaproteobacteria bacterium RIFCSPHIGHO2_12_FULL_37_34]
MKLLRYGEAGKEKPACLDDAGCMRDLSHHIPDLAGEILSPTYLAELQKIKIETLPIIENNSRIGPCIHQVGKFICIGLNYPDHAKETNADIPTEPVVFLKATSSICGPYDHTIIPHHSTHTDWEVELGIIIGKSAKRVSIEHALDYIAGYCVVNDVTERHYQRHNTTQWAKGKSCDTFGPIGPWLVTPDEMTDIHHLALWLEVDGKRYQNGNTQHMIFKVPYLISYLSQFFTLYPGDIISTGTPAGIGCAQKPNAIFLKPGQQVTLGITGLGKQQHHMIAEEVPKK